MKHFFILTLLPILALTLPGNLPYSSEKNLENDFNSTASSLKDTSNANAITSDSNYLKPLLSPQTVTSIPRKHLKVFSDQTYFTFDSHTKEPLFAPGNSPLIQQLGNDAPVFTVHTSIILHHKKSNSIAFLPRPEISMYRQVAYGGHLELPSTAVPYDYATDQKMTLSGLDFKFKDHLEFALAKSTARELQKDAPFYFTQLVNQKQPVFFKGFASGPDRDIIYKEVKGIPPVTSAVFLASIEDKGTLSVRLKQFAKAFSSFETTLEEYERPLYWIPLDTVLALSKEYTPQVHQQTFHTTQFSFHKSLEFKVEHFAFDHLKLVEAVFST